MSTTTNLKLFKHDNPTTNTNQFDVEKALNENWDKLDKNAGEVASKIQTLENTTNAKDTSQDTEIEVLKAENALLKSQIPSATVVGESIHLDDSSNMQCYIAPIGASVQEGTPSIEYEAPIESVGDNIQLLQVKAPSTTVNGVTFTNNGDGTITANGTATANTTYPFTNEDGSSVKSSRLEKGTYTISSINSDYSKHFLQTAIKDDNGTENWYNSSPSITIDTVGLSYCVLIYVRSGTTLNNVVFKPKIEKGTKATLHSPYRQGSIEIYNCNENWFDKNKVTTAIGGTSGYVSTDYIPARVGDVIKKNNKTTLFLYDKTKAQITSISTFTTGTITIENVEYIRCNVLETEVDTFMLVKNQDLPSEYIAHQSQTKALYTQQPFRAIGDVKDRFVKQNGVWYEEHNIERIIFDETQSIYAGAPATGTGTNTIYVAFGYKNASLKNTEINTMCENLKSNSGSYLYANDVEGITQSTSQIIFRINRSRANTINEVKTFLASNPITVYAKRAEPLLIPCTAEQVEVLESFNTYKNVTNISSDSIGELEVTYSKDLETLYNNLSQAVLGGN